MGLKSIHIFYHLDLFLILQIEILFPANQAVFMLDWYGKRKFLVQFFISVL